MKQLNQVVGRVHGRDTRLGLVLDEALDGLKRASDILREAIEVPALESPPESMRPRPETMRTAQTPSESSDLGAERKLLRVLVERAPIRLTKAQLGTLAGLSSRGGTFGTYLSRLRTAGYLDESDGLFAASESGIAALGEVPPAPSSPEEIRAMWKRAVGESAAGRLIDALAAVYPRGLSRDELAESVGLTAGAGTFGTYLSRLSSNRLIEKRGGLIYASDALMGKL